MTKQTQPEATELFTKGEWYARDLHIMNAGKTRLIGQAFVVQNFNSLLWKQVEDVEGNANASLMAAAPDLYYALKEMILAFDENNIPIYKKRIEAQWNAILAIQKANPNYKP